MTRAFLNILATAVVVTGSTNAQDQWENGFPFRCERPLSFESVTRRETLPRALQEELQNYAMPGEYWNATDDVVENEKRIGLAFIWHRGRRWIMVGGWGGIVTAFKVEAYDIRDGKVALVSPAFDQGNSGQYCELALKLAHG